MISYKTLKEIIQKIGPDNYDCEFLGLRIVAPDYDGYNLPIGAEPPESYVWSDGEQTDDTVGGTCTIDIRAFLPDNDHSGYAGDRVWLIGGESTFFGEDVGEIVFRDPVILAIFNF